MAKITKREFVHLLDGKSVSVEALLNDHRMSGSTSPASTPTRTA